MRYYSSEQVDFTIYTTLMYKKHYIIIKGRILLSEKLTYFYIFLLLSKTEKLGHDIQYKHNKTQKVRGRRQTSQEPCDPRNNTVTSSLSFLFSSHIPHLRIKKLATQKHKV